MIQPPRCPECGKSMTLRVEETGRFWRCFDQKVCPGKMPFDVPERSEPLPEPKATTVAEYAQIQAPEEQIVRVLVSDPLPTTDHAKALGLALIDSELPEAVSAREAMAKENRLKTLDRLANELRFAVRAKNDPRQAAMIADVVERMNKVIECTTNG